MFYICSIILDIRIVIDAREASDCRVIEGAHDARNLAGESYYN